MTRPNLQLVSDDPSVIAPLPEPPRTWATGHSVQLYGDDDYLRAAATAFLLEGHKAGQPLLVVATHEHWDAIACEMRARGTDPDDLAHGRDLIVIDADVARMQVMRDGVFDRPAFDQVIGAALTRLTANRQYAVVRGVGELVNLLWRDGEREAAILVEEAWNLLARQYRINLLCAYALHSFSREADSGSFEAMCGHHDRILPSETYLQGDETERLRQIALLQQRAMALESEVQHRRHLEGALRDALAHRRRVEEELRRREIELRDFLENGLEPMHWVGPDGTVLWANRAELDLLGYPRDEYVGQHVSKFYADPDVAAAILDRLGRGLDLRNEVVRMRAKDGTTRTVLINSNVYWQDGRFMHTRCFTRDITGLSFQGTLSA